VRWRIEERGRKKSAFGGPLGTLLGQYSDVFIIFGSLFFLALKDTYYNFGRFGFINFSYVEPGLLGHLGLGILSFAGVLMLSKTASKKKEKGAGLWRRSERMYMLFIFAALGLTTGLFSGTLFTGILVLTALIYISILRRGLSKSKKPQTTSRTFYRSKRFLSRVPIKIVELLRGTFKGLLKVIGVVLLGLYITIEKGYLTFGKIAFKSKKFLTIEQRRDMHERTDHPVTAETPREKTEQVEKKVIIEEEPPSIELPPQDPILDDDQPSYLGDQSVNESLLIEYKPTAKKEEVLIDVAEFMVSEGKTIIIVSTQPATAHYREKFSGTQGIRIINLPDTSTLPGKDEIPMTNLEYFNEIFESLHHDCVFIFEPLSNLILHVGIAQAFRFISQTQTTLSDKDVAFIVFLNKVGHDKKDISNFENLFMNLADVENNKLKRVR
jgi:hypothetical protein